ncbi:S1C family serine protease [Sphingosinicella terrae]|jgi:V8-like Glu-specific endopeptidase|uniref:S1C family serine protease n=1 Tax=Sphingosinicella terrae TaxID=2172047 RepID=UPI000E0D7E78|nr:serine protease [Sphingosinicella terrae]
MARLLAFLAALLVLASPARADDISAAGRGVVRVVVMAFEDGEPVDFGHGSGFAVAANRVVTNAHVVALAAQDPKALSVVVGVVPSEGAQAYRARVVAADPARDLALLEFEQGSLPPLALYTGPLDDGSGVAALGYPGNVDLATAQSAGDYIVPLPPTRSAGIFSNVRPINGITTLLHTANIARGHSGGPLLDPCGRVIGVNTLITRNQEGDSPFAFAVANRELTAFLRQAGQAFQATAAPCVSMSERLREDEARAEAEARAQREARATRERQARELALARVEESRETRLGISALLLVLSLLAFGGAGILIIKNRQRPAIFLGAGGGLLLIAAIIVFFTRPSLEDATAAQAAAVDADAASASATGFVGRNLCELVPERSRVTASSSDPVPLEWSEGGCVNQRTQYARNGDVWTRVLVPASEQAVSVLQFSPSSGEYVVTRYQLGAQRMARVRELRRGVDVKSCTANAEARTVLADQLREIGELLPELPNERLVYRCRNQGAASAEGAPKAGTGS